MSISQKNRIFFSKWDFLTQILSTANLGKKFSFPEKKSVFFGNGQNFLRIFPSAYLIVLHSTPPSHRILPSLRLLHKVYSLSNSHISNGDCYSKKTATYEVYFSYTHRHTFIKVTYLCHSKYLFGAERRIHWSKLHKYENKTHQQKPTHLVFIIYTNILNRRVYDTKILGCSMLVISIEII